MSYVDHTKSIGKYGEDIWYVNKGSGNDANSGKTPDQAFETIGAGITALSAGDAISVAPGTYTEVGLDLDTNNCQMWFEIGVIIDPASGTALIVSGDYCKVTGMHKITPAAGATGLLISGNSCHLDHGTILTGAIGVQITGQGLMLENYAVGFPTSIAYDIQGIQGRLTNCRTVGNAATIGYKISNNVDTGVLDNCTSVGHETAGYSISTGSQDWTILSCSSGAGDGRWVDVDGSNVWSNFTYDDMVYHDTDWAVVGGAAGTDNLFKITGSVSISYVYGDVETQIHADVDTLYLELDDGANQIDVTKKVAATDPNSAEVGSLFIKTKTSADVITLMQSDEVRFNEDATGRKGGAGFIVNQKNGANTYLRVGWTGTGNTGVIHWHIQWEPLDEAGFVEGM